MKAHRYCRADIISQTGADGLVGDPRSCKFDPSTIVCKQGDNSTCLTPKQAVALKQIYEGMKTPDGHPIYPGRMPGVEGGWSNFITGASPGSSRLHNYGTGYLKYFVFGNPAWITARSALAGALLWRRRCPECN